MSHCPNACYVLGLFVTSIDNPQGTRSPLASALLIFLESKMASIHGLQTKSRALFTVAKGSDISPRELANAGFLMVDGQFYPADIKQIQQRLSHDFMVWEESTPFMTVFRFQRGLN